MSYAAMKPRNLLIFSITFCNWMIQSEMVQWQTNMCTIAGQYFGIVSAEWIDLFAEINLECWQPPKKSTNRGFHWHKCLCIGIGCLVYPCHLVAEPSEGYFAGLDCIDEITADFIPCTCCVGVKEHAPFSRYITKFLLTLIHVALEPLIFDVSYSYTGI